MPAAMTRVLCERDAHVKHASHALVLICWQSLLAADKQAVSLGMAQSSADVLDLGLGLVGHRGLVHDVGMITLLCCLA